VIKFEPMSDDDFQMYLRKAIPQYAIDQARSGNWKPAEAAGRARAEFQQTLPNGMATPDHYFFSIVDEENHKVGMLWWAMNQRGSQRIAFIADFFIFGEFRHKGYEAQSLQLLEEEVRQQGVERLEVQVFAHNAEDAAMYRAGNYSDVSLFLGKNL
jgi:GNAT superfamily N-acetyltransferase